MGNKELAGKLLLAVATAGLTTCDGIGAVDPAPPPLTCDTVSGGQQMVATGTISGQKLSIELDYQGEPFLDAPPVVEAVSGLSIDSIKPDQNDTNTTLVEATLEDGLTTAQFKISGTVSEGSKTCNVSRVFTVTVTNGSVNIAERFDLPLPPRRHASIEMLRRDGLEVELRAAGAGAGEVVTWTPTGGAVHKSEGGRARWRLPSEPGVYQVEMLVDRGEEGFALDTLALEVLG